MQRLSQRDSKWGNQYLGFSNSFIRDFGCTISALAMIIGTTPDVVNERLKIVQGFSDGKTLGMGNLVVWSKIPEAFPGIQINRVWSYDNNDVKGHVPNVLVEVPADAIGSPKGKHWVVFIGNMRCNDPWTGWERNTKDFVNDVYGYPTGYCVITGKWNQVDKLIPSSILLSILNGAGSDGDKLLKIKALL